MNLADKIIMLRKKRGWSQEELAERMGVTRQSISKWEGAQSVPELEKIIAMSELFGVSTDFLLKNDGQETAETEAPSPAAGKKDENPRVGVDEIGEYFEKKRKMSSRTATATALCVLSPVTLLLLGALSDEAAGLLPETLAVGIGLLTLFAMVDVAVALFLLGASRLERFSYLEKDGFLLDAPARGAAEQRWKECEARCTRARVVATVLCVLSATPIFGALLFGEDGLALLFSVPMLLVIVSVGVFLFVLASERWGCIEELLKRDGRPREDAKWAKIKDTVGTVYWLVAVAIFLAYSFITDDWGESWIIWPVAGVLFAALATILDAIGKKK